MLTAAQPTTSPSADLATGAPELIDTLRRIETPEGVDVALSLAGPAPRASAWLIDLLIRGALYMVLTPLAALAGVGAGLMLLGLFLVEWFYPVLFEVWRGATPGKRALGLRVVHDDGTPVGPSASLLRNLLRVVDFLPMLYGLGLVSMVLDRDFRRLGDIAAGTLVIHGPRAAGARDLPRHPPRPPARALDLATAQAILDFAERSPRLSEARRAELAVVLMPDLPAAAAADELLGVANWLAGGERK